MHSKKIRNLIIGLLAISLSVFGLFNLNRPAEAEPLPKETEETQIVEENEKQEKKEKDESEKSEKLEESEEEQEEEEPADDLEEEKQEAKVEPKVEKEEIKEKNKEKEVKKKEKPSSDTKKEKKPVENAKKEEEKPKTPPKTEEKIEKTAKVVITDGRTKTILPQKEMTIKEGDTAWDVTLQALKQAGIQFSTTGSGSGLYVQGINNLYEFDGGPNSGWHIRVDGQLISSSAGAYAVKENQTIHWNYTYDYTKDSENW